MKKVTEIKPNNYNIRSKLRTAAYARVSTNNTDQLQSLEAQVKHYTDYINLNPEWEFVEIYVDEGISGTKKENRKGLQRLIKDVQSKRIDFVITKSISRFARNTTDCLEIVRLFSELDVGILFEKEGINTIKSDSELILSVLSSIAAEESVSISQNNKWAIKKRFENGTFKLSSPPYGYDYDGRSLVINKEEADVVKVIFNESLSGKGSRAIAMLLNKEGVKSPKGSKWGATSIKVILENEKYTGDVIFQKTFIDDSFRRNKNEGQLDQYYIENNHPAIISKKDYEAVKVLIQQRGKENGSAYNKNKYTVRYVFSGKIKCLKCGNTYKRRIHYLKKNQQYIAYACNTHISNRKACDALFIKETEIHKAFITMLNKLYTNKEIIISPILNGIRDISMTSSNHKILEVEKRIKENAERVKVLLDLMSKGYLDPPVFNERNNILQAELIELKGKLEMLKSAEHSDEELEKLYKEVSYIETFDETLFSKFVETITVNSPTEIEFKLKCGLNLKEKIGR